MYFSGGEAEEKLESLGGEEGRNKVREVNY